MADVIAIRQRRRSNPQWNNVFLAIGLTHANHFYLKFVLTPRNDGKDEVCAWNVVNRITDRNK